MKDKDGKPIVALPEKHIEIKYLDFSKPERLIYEALYRNAKSKFLDYEAKGTVTQFSPTSLPPRHREMVNVDISPSMNDQTRNVTAIFSILMRLRQAVLHPSLVLKRLKENLEQNKKLKGRSSADKATDLDEQDIQELIEKYGGLEVDDEETRECAICFDVSFSLSFFLHI